MSRNKILKLDWTQKIKKINSLVSSVLNPLQLFFSYLVPITVDVSPESLRITSKDI